MLIGSFQEWLSAGGIPALLITVGFMYLAIKATGAALRILASAVAMFTALYMLCPQLYFQLAEWITAGVGAAAALASEVV